MEPGQSVHARGYRVTNHHAEKIFGIPNKTEPEFLSVRDSVNAEVSESLEFTPDNRILIRNGNILEYNGSPIRLIGYGDYGLVSEEDFDYGMFLDKIANYNLNLVRIWVNYHWVKSLSPFEKNSFGEYDLYSPSQKYNDRLKDFVAYAEGKGIIVQVTLFDAVALQDKGNRWRYFPYNTINNVHDFILSNQTSEFVATSGPVWNVQEQLISQVAAHLGDYGNIIYEIMNEPNSHGVAIEPFHSTATSTLRAALEPYTGSKIISVNIEDDSDLAWAQANADLVAIHVHHPASRADNYNNISIPVIISNDGDETQGTQAQGSEYNASKREKRTKCFLQKTFGTGAVYGHNHFEFLDKGINGDSWRTTPPDYNPRASNVDEGILNVLNPFPDSGIFPPPDDCSNGEENGWGG